MSDRYEQLFATEGIDPPCLNTSSLFSRGMESNLRSLEERRRVQRSHMDDYLGRLILQLRAASAHISMQNKRFGFFIG